MTTKLETIESINQLQILVNRLVIEVYQIHGNDKEVQKYRKEKMSTLHKAQEELWRLEKELRK